MLPTAGQEISPTFHVNANLSLFSHNGYSSDNAAADPDAASADLDANTPSVHYDDGDNDGDEDEDFVFC